MVIDCDLCDGEGSRSRYANAEPFINGLLFWGRKVLLPPVLGNALEAVVLIMWPILIP